MDFLAPQFFPFTVALLIMVAFAIIEGIGLLLGGALSTILDTFLPDIDIDFDTDASLTTQGTFTKLLGWINVGRVPLLIIVICFLTSFGLSGHFIQSSTYSIFGAYLPVWIAVILSMFMAIPFTKLFTAGMAKIMPKDETSAVSRETFIGSIATIVLGTAKVGKPAEAKLTDEYGQEHYFMVEPKDEKDEFTQNEKVILAKESEIGFYAIKSKNKKLVD